MDNTRFWIVLMEGNRVPPGGFHAHYSLGDAEIEAARLIRKEGRPVVIMEAITKGELAEALPPIRWVGMGPSTGESREKMLQMSEKGGFMRGTKDECSKEEAKAYREKYWRECDSDGKAERLRGQIKSLQKQVEELRAMLVPLVEHEHGHGGKPVVRILGAPGGGPSPLVGVPWSKKDEDVYF